ncbi:hypothetical protein [uncultured Ilumatobacter sp.]|uniref:hypothetical protein n=1 Tax=uncultured Ilumatobacter sp. TaxID=879968 RepID=UPI00374F2758
MLSSFDDFPIHQTSHPIAQTAGTDLNHYDRYFFNGYTSDTRLFFAAAFGLYPNRHVADAHFSVVVNGASVEAEQINVHASRRAPLDRSEANIVGPIQVEVLEPLHTLRVTVDAAEHGLRADLTFVRRSAPIQEPHFFHQVGQRVLMDSTRMTQFGVWEGWIEVDGEVIDLNPEKTLGSRDRSWGVRPVGEPAPTGAPVADPQFYWLWAPLNFDSFSTHFDINEMFDGKRWHETGFVALSGSSVVEPADAMRSVDYRIGWKPGTRRAEWFEIDFEPWQGEVSTIRLEPLFDLHMLGIGYGHPEWRHGAWKGELVIAGDRWSLPVSDPNAFHHIHIQSLVRATTTGGLGQHTGLGALEQLAVGRHDPTGLVGLNDGWSA